MNIGRFHDLGPDDYTPDIDENEKIKNKPVFPLIDIEQIRQEMDTAGYGTNIIDLHTGQVIDRPASATPMDDMISEAEDI